MRSFRHGWVLALFAAAKVASAQAPSTPAAEPAPPSEPAPAVGPIEPAPSPPEPPPAPEPPSEPPPESAPAPEKIPETTPAPEAPGLTAPLGRPQVVAPADKPAATAAPAWNRANWPLTLEARLGFMLRPESSQGFDEETHLGSEVGLSLYMDIKRELAAGLEIERTSLGRGTAISALDSVSIDYTVSSAMLGFRAYPKRSEMLDLFVGLQVGVGIQGVSAQGTLSNGALLPASPYSCGAADAPAFQIGGGIGARLMLAPHWGVTARINGTGRRLSGDVIEGCAQGIGTATTLSAGLGLGYDFDLDP